MWPDNRGKPGSVYLEHMQTYHAGDFIMLAPLQIGDTVRILDGPPWDNERVGFIACIKYQDTVNESNSKYDVQFLGTIMKVRLIERRSMKFYGGGCNRDTRANMSRHAGGL